jgi:hypothetical protein
MAEKRFMVSVADVRILDVDNGDLLAVGKTLVDSSLEMTLGNTDIRGGRGNSLQAVLYHTSDLNIKVTETQFNLNFLALAVGKDIVTGDSVYQEESVTLGGGGAGTVVGTPIASSGANLYGWVTVPGGETEKVTFTGQNFTSSLGTSGQVVCVRYYATNSAARSLTISSNVLPKIVKVEMETLLISSQETTSRIGVVQIIVPTATLTGSFSLSMTSDGVSTTPLALRALANSDLTTAACSAEPVLAKIIEILDNANWYDSVIGLSIVGGDFALTHPNTKQLVVYAIPSVGAAFLAPVSGLTFASATVGTATVNSAGLVTTVAAGTSVLKVSITSKTSVDANVIITVS